MCALLFGTRVAFIGFLLYNSGHNQNWRLGPRHHRKSAEIHLLIRLLVLFNSTHTTKPSLNVAGQGQLRYDDQIPFFGRTGYAFLSKAKVPTYQ